MAELTVTPSSPRRKARLLAALPLVSLLVCSAAYAVTLGYLSILRLESFNSSIDDLGFYNQLMWITIHGGPTAWATYSQVSFYASYPWQTATFFLLVPVYAAFPSPVTLLMAQSIGLSLATIPIYLLARKYGLSGWASFALGGCYLLNFQVQSVSLNDFHLQSFYPLTFFSMVLFYEYGWKKLFLLAGAISLLTNPLTLVLTFAFLGAVLLRECAPRPTWSKLWNRFVAWSRARNALFVLVLLGVVLAAFEIGTGMIGGYHFGASTTGESSHGYLATVSSRLFFLGVTFLPFLALAFAVRETLVLLVPLGAFLALANLSYFVPYLGHQDLIEFLVVALWGLMLFASRHSGKRIVARVGRAIQTRRPRPFRLSKAPVPNLTVVTAVAATALFFVGMSPLSPWNVIPQSVANINETPSSITDITPADHFLTSAIALIPANASVLTQNNIPQLTGRYGFQWAFPGKPAPNLSRVDYILTDQSSNHFAQVWYNYLQPYVARALDSREFGIVAFGYGVMLLERGYQGSPELVAPLSYSPSELTLSTGYLNGSTAVHPAQDDPTFWYGPYVDLPAGNYTATYQLMIGPVASSSAFLLILAVANQTHYGPAFYASMMLFANDFPGPGIWTNISVHVTLHSFVASAEFPGLWPTSAATIYLGGVTVTVDPTGPS